MADPGPVVWRPPPEVVERANVTHLIRRVGARDLFDLLERSRRDVEGFWGVAEREIGLEWFEPYTRVLDESKGAPFARWYVGGKTNITLNALDRHVRSGRGQETAILWEGEDGSVERWTYLDLSRRVERIAGVLRERGVGPGDAVGVLLPMIPDAVASLLAIAKIGAIFVPLFSGFGPEAVERRLADCQAKALVTAEGFLRKGERVDLKRVADGASRRVPTVSTVLVFSRFHGEVPIPWRSGIDLDAEEAMAKTTPHPSTRPMDSEDPWMIIYTSGTTGRPKGSVHVHGGFTVKIAQEVLHQVDLQRGDVLHWVTDMGWIMGPWEVVGGLVLGGTLLLYEGAPDHPTPDRLFRLVERHRVSILGVSPTLVRSLMKHGSAGPRRCDLGSLRILASTGEPWNPEPWMWLYEEVGGGRAPIINLSGGTEVGACFLSPTPITPLRPTSLGHPALGMAVDVVDEKGNPVGRGTVGELICRRPWPGMTRGLWRDPERYLETYWRRFPGVWYHGDFASIGEDGQWYLHGRSDDTIKIAGKRVGPAEIESVLVDTGKVLEAAAVGIEDPLKGEVVHAYVILRPGVQPTLNLERELSDEVASRIGKPFRPAGIHFVSDLPRTRNAKILRRAIRAKAMGKDPGDLSGLANPKALDEIPPLKGRE